MAKQLIENPMLIERLAYIPPEIVVMYSPDPMCGCGCGKSIEVIELRTHEGEPIYSEACYMRISYKEGWIRKEAV